MSGEKFTFKPPNLDAFHEYIEKEKEKIIESVKEAYIKACMEAVNHARTTDTYKDRTNNLRSSIGFVLYYNGELVHEDFQVTGKGTGAGGDVSFKTKGGDDVSFKAKSIAVDGPAGMKSGQELAYSIAEKFSSGFIAVIVAGMHYALYVEAKGFDVLTGATLNIEAHLKGHFMAVDRNHGTKLSK